MKRTFALAALWLAGCGPPPLRSPPPEDELTPRVVGAGTEDDPVLRCGAGDSYIYVKHRYRCQNGGAPSSASRLGSRDSPRNSDILDLYRVDCPEGEKQVLVDMYGCEEIHAGRKPRAAQTLQAVQFFEQGNLDGARLLCDHSIHSRPAPVDIVQCGMLLLASDALSGEEESASKGVQSVCAKMPPADPEHPLRASFVEEVLRWVIRGQGKSKLSKDGFNAVQKSLASACSVPPDQVHPTQIDRAMFGRPPQ